MRNMKIWIQRHCLQFFSIPPSHKSHIPLRSIFLSRLSPIFEAWRPLLSDITDTHGCQNDIYKEVDGSCVCRMMDHTVCGIDSCHQVFQCTPVNKFVNAQFAVTNVTNDILNDILLISVQILWHSWTRIYEK